MNSSILDLLNTYRIVDLTHALEEDMPVWPTHPRFFMNGIESLHKGDEAFLNQITLGEHCGTHVDAPAHFVPDGETIDHIAPLNLFSQAVKIDMSGAPASSSLPRQHIEQWEKENRAIQADDIVIFYTGYEDRWALRPNHLAFLKDWPGLSREAAMYLADKGIRAVGTDVMTIDAFVHEGYPAHDVFLNRNILIIENLTQLRELPNQFIFLAMPLKIKGGSASPIRAVALIEH
nr:cyclase family protein [Pantoea sp. 201603H]